MKHSIGARYKITAFCSMAMIALLVVVGIGQLNSQPTKQDRKLQGQAALQSGGQLFAEAIGPLFQEHCQMCHNSESRNAGLDLSTREALLRGGKSGPAIVPGNAKESLLYKLVAHEQEPGMPSKAPKLPGEIVARVAAWIDAGAPFDNVAADTETKLNKEHLRSILETQCFTCHGGKLEQAGLSMETRETLLKGSDNGLVVVPGNAQASLVVKKIKHEHEPGMPYGSAKLSEEVIAEIVAWINAVAPYDQPLKMPESKQVASPSQGSKHWAFSVPQRPPVPTGENRAWVRNPIDAFLSAEHQKRDLQPLPPTDERVLLRRVYLDLVGLPPNLEETKDFLSDRSPEAYEKVVDQLLSSPRYGERWGRHWMDVWAIAIGMEPGSLRNIGTAKDIFGTGETGSSIPLTKTKAMTR
jgi:mono/diheme cytochrome c family protein